MKAKLLSLIIAIALTLTSLGSLSACGAGVGSGGSGTGDPSDGSSTGNNPPISGGDSAGTGEGNDVGTSDDTDKAPEFYPGFGDEDIKIDDIAASTRALLSVVSITSHFERYYGSGFGYDYDDSSTQSYVSYGTGVFIDVDRETGDAYVLTNYHVVYHYDSITSNKISDDIEIFLYGQETKNYAIKATYVGGSMTEEVALLKIEGSEIIKNSYAIPITAGNSDECSVLDTVVAIGNSEGEGIQATAGHISVDNQELSITAADQRTTITLNVMRFSAAINEGNSGGGLFDSTGRMVGLVVAKKLGSDVDNLAYAIPINRAMAIAGAIKDTCNGTTNTQLYRYMLGFTMNSDVRGLEIDPETGKIDKVSLVKVDTVISGGLLEGKIAKGDIIRYVTVDGVKREITQVYQVVEHMFNAREGSVVTIGVTRGNIDVSFTETMTEECKTLIK